MTTPAVDPDFIASRTTEVRLPGGLLVRIRPIVPEDREELARGYAQLSEESRVRRFLSPPGHLSDEMLEYLTEVDYRDHFALVALAVEEPGSPGVGVARYVRLADRPDTAEAAVTVRDDHQNRGVGTALLAALAATGLENGVRRFCAYALEGNPILDLARAMGAEVVPDLPGTVQLVVDLEHPEPAATWHHGGTGGRSRHRRARVPDARGRAMATEKHRGAPKKQVKKQSAAAKAKQAKKLAARTPGAQPAPEQG